MKLIYLWDASRKDFLVLVLHVPDFRVSFLFAFTCSFFILRSLVPREALCLVSWQELELMICGNRTVDIELLKKYDRCTTCSRGKQIFAVANLATLKTHYRHTIYSPSTYNENSEIVQMFWKVLTEFSDEDKGNFLNFAWAR